MLKDPKNHKKLKRNLKLTEKLRKKKKKKKKKKNRLLLVMKMKATILIKKRYLK